MEEHEKKLKLLQQKPGSFSSINAVKCSGTTKDSLDFGGYDFFPCKTLLAQSFNENVVITSSRKITRASTSSKPCLQKSLSTDTNVALKSDSKPSRTSLNISESNMNVHNVFSVAEKFNTSVNIKPEDRTLSQSIGVNCTSASVDGIVKELQKTNLSCEISRQLKNNSRDEEHTQNSGHLCLNDKSRNCEAISKSISKELKKNNAFSQSHSIFTLHNWDSAAEIHPIENDEWIAFLQHTMEEVMEGDVDSLEECNSVGVLVSPLLNPGASCRVMEYIASLLSLPFVVDGITEEDISKISQVYLDAKIVPHLVYASKLIARRKGYDSDDPSPLSNELLCPVSDLSADELQALESIYLLLCHLIYMMDDFVIQFCDAIAILNATTLIQQFLLLDRRKIRVVTDLVAILSHILRVLPENAVLVEEIVLGKSNKECSGIDLARLLTHHSSLLKTRTCVLIQLLGQYSCRALHLNWTVKLQEDLENLMYDSCKTVEEAAKEAITELKQLPFYTKKRVLASES